MNQNGLYNDQGRGGVVIVTGIVCCAVATTAVALRLFTRHHINAFMGFDDLLSIFSLLSIIGMVTAQGVNASKYLGRHMADLAVSGELSTFLYIFWITEIFYNLALLFCKLTLLFQYFRIFRKIRSMRIAYVVAIILITFWNFAQVILVIFQCLPVSGFWTLAAGTRCQDLHLGVYLNAGGNLATDVIILLLPLPSLWKLRLPISQKIALFGIFGIGSITIIISALRVVAIKNAGEVDLSYDSIISACVSIGELTSGITCAALATLRPLASRLFPSMFRSQSGDSSQRYGDAFGKAPPTIGSDGSNKRRNRSDVAHISFTNSEEDLFRNFNRDVELNNVSLDTSTRGWESCSPSHENGRYTSPPAGIYDGSLAPPPHNISANILGKRLGLQPKCEATVTSLRIDDESGPSTAIVAGADMQGTSAIVVEKNWQVEKSAPSPTL